MASHTAEKVSFHKCHHCDEALEIPYLGKNERALCPTCGSHVQSGSRLTWEQLFCLSLSAIIILLIAVPFHYIELNASGNVVRITLWDSVINVYKWDKPLLAGINFLIIIGIPFAAISSAMIMFFVLWTEKLKHWFRPAFRIYSISLHWMMVEVFVIGVLVSLIKIISLASIDLGCSFYLYFAFVVLSLIILNCVDRSTLWEAWIALLSDRKNDRDLLPKNLDRENSVACEYCGMTNSANAEKCVRCDSHIHKRNPNGLRNATAFLITAAILFVPANVFPVMTTYQFGEPIGSTILEGVVTFLHHGDYLIASVIFLASIVIPLAKILSLSYLCWASKKPKKVKQAKEQTRLYQVTELLGKWSMIDVFVVVVMVTLVQIGNIMFVRSGFGIVAFAGVVVTTILAAHQFDQRQLWDAEIEQ